MDEHEFDDHDATQEAILFPSVEYDEPNDLTEYDDFEGNEGQADADDC